MKITDLVVLDLTMLVNVTEVELRQKTQMKLQELMDGVNPNIVVWDCKVPMVQKPVIALNGAETTMYLIVVGDLISMTCVPRLKKKKLKLETK